MAYRLVLPSWMKNCIFGIWVMHFRQCKVHHPHHSKTKNPPQKKEKKINTKKPSITKPPLTNAPTKKTHLFLPQRIRTPRASPTIHKQTILNNNLHIPTKPDTTPRRCFTTAKCEPRENGAVFVGFVEPGYAVRVCAIEDGLWGAVGALESRDCVW